MLFLFVADFHPLVVHFPIALLTLYALVELVRIRFLAKQPWLFHVKAFLVVFGVLGAFFSLLTGEAAGETLEHSSSGALVQTHAAFATASTWLFVVPAAAYLLLWLVQVGLLECKKGGCPEKVLAFAKKIASWVIRPSLAVPFSFVGLVCILVTGALGGALAYGPQADPVVSFVYSLFF